MPTLSLRHHPLTLPLQLILWLTLTLTPWLRLKLAPWLRLKLTPWLRLKLTLTLWLRLTLWPHLIQWPKPTPAELPSSLPKTKAGRVPRLLRDLGACRS